MEQSILNSVKKLVNIDPDDDSFDTDILTHANTAFSVLLELGVGPEEGFVIEDANATWDALNLTAGQLSKVRSYVPLKVRLLFDPPSTSFHLAALEKQVQELEVRLNISREVALPKPEVIA